MRLTILAAANESDPFGSVKEFFNSSTWHFITLTGWFFVVVVWLSCAYWVFKDSRRRIDDKVVVAVAVLTALIFGLVGVFIYTILRPPEYLDDRRERELEMRMMEAQLTDDSQCPYCRTKVSDDFLVCPNCARRLRELCSSCRRPVEPAWKVCPYCEKQLSRAAAPDFDFA